MAFIRKSGSKYTVHQGNTGEKHSSFGSRKAAQAEVDRLHKKNKPKASSKGAKASKKFAKGSGSNLMKKKKK